MNPEETTMGWLFHNDMLQSQTPAEYIAEQYSRETDVYRVNVLATATVGGTIYAAIRNEIKGACAAYVFCGVFLFKNNKKDGFGYKSIDEAMGPCEVDCPDRIMRLLSPVEDIPDPGYAAEWRANVSVPPPMMERSNTSSCASRSSGPSIAAPASEAACRDRENPIFKGANK
jgi:hypothetical protein